MPARPQASLMLEQSRVQQPQVAARADQVVVTRSSIAQGGFTVPASDTLAVMTVGITSLAQHLPADASAADILEAQLDYMQARGHDTLFNFLRWVLLAGV
jgi:hypothetical protein